MADERDRGAVNQPRGVRCRPITPADADAVAALLHDGFPERSHAFWSACLRRLAVRELPDGLPRYGFLLEADQRVVGVQLVIAAQVEASAPRCNVSSWYVLPAYRSLAPLLARHVLRPAHATFLNVSPAPHTRATLDALGYRAFCRGQFIAVPVLRWPRRGMRVAAAADTSAVPRLNAAERTILADHAAFGCTILLATEGINVHPFVLQPLRWRGFLPFMRLVYCRSIDDFVACAGAIGRYLARRGYGLVVIDANGPIDGLVGTFRPTTPRYFRGAVAPRLGDLTYTEFVVFGI